jgi:two-component system sensor histidine kinase AlgZ
MIEGARSSLRIPDLCNSGVWVRVLLFVNIGALLGALKNNRHLGDLLSEVLTLAIFIEPVTLGSLIALCMLKPRLEAWGQKIHVAALIVIPMAIARGYTWLFQPLFESSDEAWRAVFWAGAAAALMLSWFDLRHRAQTPAISEARLMALTARIRPHFLFNSLNAVLGVIRSDPRRAEQALEELSDLIRVLMRDNRDLVPLSDEIRLCHQYIDLERLRMGERLEVVWDVESAPMDALMPPLMLQPLLENAVYYGIEPLQGSGEITVKIWREGERLRMLLSNPHQATQVHHSGNQIALENIRERLMLFFDLEGSLETTQKSGRYQVAISFPYRKARPS